MRHIRTCMFRGFLALIPFGLAYAAVHTVYVQIDQRIASVLRESIGMGFPGLGILLLMCSLYLLGLLVSNYVGRKALGIVESITGRIPLVKTVYRIGKQIADSFSLPGKQAFQRPLLVRSPATAGWTVGFLTGSVRDDVDSATLYKVYVPLPPNPTSGMVLLVKPEETRDPGWSVEDALKCLMSGGIIGPESIR